LLFFLFGSLRVQSPAILVEMDRRCHRTVVAWLHNPSLRGLEAKSNGASLNLNGYRARLRLSCGRSSGRSPLPPDVVCRVQGNEAFSAKTKASATINRSRSEAMTMIELQTAT